MDFDGFERQVLPIKNKLYRFACRLLDSSDEAKDVVQDALIRVWNGREQLATIENVEAWCMRITKNLALDKLRTRQRKPTDSLDQTATIIENRLTPHESAEISESMQRISLLIAALPEKQRQVMHLRDVEGYSYNEICEILELDMNQVKVNLFRARNAVREKFVKINAYGL